MKELSIVDSEELRRKTKDSLDALPAAGVDPRMVVELTKALASYYELNAYDLRFSDFKTDHVVDDTGVYHEAIEFQIHQITRIGKSVWIFGEEYSLNLTEFSETVGKIMEEVLETAE